MNAIMQIPTRKRSNGTKDELPIAFPAPANDDRLTSVGAIFGPEQGMEVSFVGLSRDEARRALASFPGGCRYTSVDA